MHLLFIHRRKPENRKVQKDHFTMNEIPVYIFGVLWLIVFNNICYEQLK